jgi:hypothetical protein
MSDWVPMARECAIIIWFTITWFATSRKFTSHWPWPLGKALIRQSDEFTRPVRL